MGIDIEPPQSFKIMLTIDNVIGYSGCIDNEMNKEANMWKPKLHDLKVKFENHKNNCITRGKESTLTFEDFQHIYERNGGFCDYTGVKLSMWDNKHKRQPPQVNTGQFRTPKFRGYL